MRAQCARCGLPQSVCLCHWIAPTHNTVPVLILQHPSEVHEAKGSVRLLGLSLAQCQVEVGETFEPHILQRWLDAAPHNVLLYPDEDGAASAQAATIAATCQSVRLIVLDGTWRKSRKLLHLNPLLQALPRLALADLAPSRYVIRKAHKAGQLSTLEATCAALSQLEGNASRYAPLLAAFDQFIAHRSTLTPSIVRR